MWRYLQLFLLVINWVFPAYAVEISSTHIRAVADKDRMVAILGTSAAYFLPSQSLLLDFIAFRDVGSGY